MRLTGNIYNKALLATINIPFFSKQKSERYDILRQNERCEKNIAFGRV